MDKNNSHIELTKMKNIWEIGLIVFVLIFLIQISIVSAWEFDNVKDFVKTKDMTYGKVTITNAFGLGATLEDIELKFNTGTCWSKCSAETEIKMYSKGKLIDKVDFKTLDNKATSIQSYQFYIREYKDGTENRYICEDKGSNVTKCSYKDVPAKITTWTPYNFEEVEAGIYYVKLEGTKQPSQSVDWIITTQGIKINEWNVWSGNSSYPVQTGLIAYYDFEDLSDKSGNGYNLVINGSAQLKAGGIKDKYGEVSRSTSSWFSTPGSSGKFNFGVNFTIVGWFNSTANTYQIPIGTGAGGWAIELNATQIWKFADVIGTHVIENNIYTPLNKWTFFAVTGNSSHICMWINLTERDCRTGFSAGTGGELEIGRGGQAGYAGYMYWDKSGFDELGFYNRTLNETEIEWVYNYSTGGTYPYIAPETPENMTVNLTSPINATVFLPSTTNITFYANYTIENANFTNATHYVWKGTTLFNSTAIIITGNTTNSTTLLINNFVAGDYLWNVYACGRNLTGTIFCKWAPSNNTFSINKMTENSQTYNATSYETAVEGFVINITYDSSSYSSILGNLIYNETSYTGTKTGTGNTVLFSKGGIQTGSTYGNKTFHWEIGLINSSGTTYAYSTNYSQMVLNANLSICGLEGGNTPFLNFSFKDESDNSIINASNDLSSFTYWLGDGTTTKAYTFQNATENSHYSFCALPNRTFTVDLSFKYSGAAYPLRTFTYDNQAISNTTTQKTLYLLGSADGIYSAIRTADTGGGAISGVTVQYERQIGGIWILLGQEVTGDDGVATFWVNPNYQYRFTASKTGYANTQVTIQPSQTQYTLTMSTTAGGGAFVSDIKGIKWSIYPGSGSLTATTNQKFNATITSSLSNLENCKFELVNAKNTSQVLATTTLLTNSSYCFLTITYTTTKDQKIFGRLSIDTTNTTGFVVIDADTAWIIFDFTGKKPWNSITSFFSDVKDLAEMGEGSEAEFNRIVLFFLATTILIGVFMFFSGIELSNPGLSIVIIWCIILIASIGGFLSYNSGSLAYGDTTPDIVSNYGFFFLFTMLGGAYFLSMIRRTGE